METQSKVKPVGINGLSVMKWLAAASCFLGVTFASAAPLTINVVGVGPDGTQTALPDYRWTVEEDATKLSVPGQPATTANYSFSFHTSYMPVVAAGRAGVAAKSELESRTADPDYARIHSQPLPDLDASKRYYVSIAATGFQMGGAPVVFSSAGATATVYLNQYPLPTAQISIFAFNDNSPINGAPDLPQETGLAGFTVILNEAGGHYGQSGGAVTQDGFGNPLGTTYSNADGTVLERGSGIVRTGPDGTVVIKNLFPGKYTIVLVPPVNSDWHQTSTIEGTRGIDAWVKNNEPSFFQEFGPPGHHVFVGFTRSGSLPIFSDTRAVQTPPCDVGVAGCTVLNLLNGTHKITGKVVNIHNSRPPVYNFEKGSPVPECWVGLNEAFGGLRALYAAPCAKDSTFAIPDVPPGTYQLVVWDDPLDMIIGTKTITVSATNPVLALGDVPVFSWFGRFQGRVFQDIDGTGLPFFAEAFNKPYIKVDPVTGIETEETKAYAAGDLKPAFGEGIANNIRFRDGSIYQSAVTKKDGTFAFTEVFPFFNWMIAEADFARFKATGATIVSDAGGVIDQAANTSKLWSAETGSFGSNDPAYAYNPWARLNPQLQETCTQAQVDANKDTTGKIIDPTACFTVGEKYYRTEQGVILVEGMQTFLGQTNHIEWGKQPYAGQLNGPKNENGGIAGIVHYAITRAEDDPRFAAPENWEPGVPRVQINLFLDCDGDGKVDKPANDGTGQCIALSSADYVYAQPDVDNYPYCWRNPNSCGLTTGQKGPEDVVRSGDGTTFAFGDVFSWGGPNEDQSGQLHIGLGKTDSWDDSIPTECVKNPSVLPAGNGGIPFLATLDCFDGLFNFNQVRPAVFDGGYGFGRVAGQAELPVFIGSTGNGTYIVEAVAPPGYLHQGNGDKNVVFGDELAASPAALPFSCVGMELPVPQYLTLFPDELNPNYTGAGQVWNKCDMKAVPLMPGTNPAPDFYMFTEAPVAGHGVGFILDDTATEFNRFAPTFGEKYAPPHLPVSVQDWTGREITRVYSDQFGSYNFLVPSSFTVNPPFPSGVMPSMMVSCMNHPGPIDDTREFLADGFTRNPTFGQKIIDPHFNRKYTQFCYTLQYLAGKTTYLDTPVLPIAAFASVVKNPLDCECQDKTPAIYSVNNADTAFNSGNNGPWVPAAGGRLTIVSSGAAVEVANPAFDPAATTGLASRKTITRDYSFGPQDSPGTVMLGNTMLPLAVGTQWNPNILVVDVPAGAQSGQLTIKRGDNSRETVVGLTVHVGGIAPIVVQPGASIQAVIDAQTTPVGALISIPPGTYNEYLILDKRVRLQGWGADSVTINASKASTNGLAAWRTLLNKKVDARCGTSNGVSAALPCPSGTPIDADTGAPIVVAGDNRTFDTLPGQTLGINMANNEPILFGAEEGAGILAVGKLLTTNTGVLTCADANVAYRIDGLSVTGSDSGGGILASGYNCNLQITNNRVMGNYGTYGGGIRIGHTALAADNVYTSGINNSVLIDHNWIAQNGASEIASGDGGGGGVTLGTGSSNYVVSSNFICGNFSMSDGGGISHVGLSADSNLIVDNKILLNQTFNQSADPTGGGLFIGGQLVVGAGVASGTGNVTVDRNLIQHNHAGAGAGGGVSVARTVSGDNLLFTNNMIDNNAAAFAGGGVVIAEAPGVKLVNNTIAGNVSTATNRQSFAAGVNNQSTPQVAGVALLGGASPVLVNNIIWGNRSYTWSITPADPALPQTSALTFSQNWDLGGVAPADARFNVLTSPANSVRNASYNVPGNNNRFLTQAQVNFVRPISFAAQNNPDQPLVLPETTIMQTALTFDEGGNFINVILSPLTPWNADVSPRGDYHIRPLSQAIDGGQSRVVGNGVPSNDFDGNPRGTAFIDIGADELSASADLAVVVSNGVNGVLQGYPVTYAIVMTNHGSDAVTGAVLTATRPTAMASWTWTCAPAGAHGCGTAGNSGTTATINKTLGTVAAGESVTITATGVVGATATGDLSLTATVTALGAVADPNMANNTDTDSDPITRAQADLAVTVDNTRTSVLRGTTGVTYTVVVTNNGPTRVVNAPVLATLPGATRFVVATGGWTCVASAGSTCTATGSGNAVRGGLASLISGGTASYKLVGRVPVTAPLGDSTLGVVVNAPAIVEDTNLLNNSASDTDTVVQPVLVSITPASGLRGTTVAVTINGSDLAAATGVSMSGTGVTCTGITKTTTTVSANCAVTSNAALTARNVTVTSSTNGPSTTLTGAITVRAPVISSVTPAAGLRGTSVAVTINGVDLAGATGVTGLGTGVTCTMTGKTATTVSANCAVATNASVTAVRNITVTTAPNGPSNTLPGAFTVLTPVLTAVTPTAGTRGTLVGVTLTGTDLAGATGVVIAGGGVTCNGIVPGATMVTANCNITLGAAPTARNVTVTSTLNGPSNVLPTAFTVN